jgi:maltooligosyltrehalose trehalohydrolase
VRNGRRAEFARFAAFADAEARARIPDPGADATFEASKLRWEERERPGHRERLALVRELISARNRDIVPRLAGARSSGHPEIVNGVLHVSWRMGDGSELSLRVNFGAQPATIPGASAGATVYQSGVTRAPNAELHLEPGGVCATLHPPRA